MPRLVQLTSSAASPQRAGRLLPGQRPTPGRARRVLGQRRCALGRAVDQPQRRHAGLEQGHRHGPGRPAGAEQQRCRPCSGRQSGACWRRLARKPRPSLFSPSVRPSVAHQHRVDGADPPRGRVELVDQPAGRLLVRHRDVPAAKSEAGQRPKGQLEIRRLDRQRDVGAVDPVALGTSGRAAPASGNGPTGQPITPASRALPVSSTVMLPGVVRPGRSRPVRRVGLARNLRTAAYRGSLRPSGRWPGRRLWGTK